MICIANLAMQIQENVFALPIWQCIFFLIFLLKKYIQQKIFETFLLIMKHDYSMLMAFKFINKMSINAHIQ